MPGHMGVKMLTKSLLFLFVFGLLTVTIEVQGRRAHTDFKKKVVLISIDGFRPEFYLEDRYLTPTLKSLRDQGVFAIGAEPVFPSLTYPNHTTLITGVYPSKHGVLSNTLFSWQKGPS